MPRILIVEDNDSNRDLLQRYLEVYDHQVTVAVDGSEGLRMAREESHNIDLILMDMNLPEVDGWEATRRLKQDDATRSIPVIAITAHAMVGDRAKALAAGCDEYTTKPIDFHELLCKIDALYNKAPTP